MSDLQQKLSGVGAATLEQLAFLFSMPEDADRMISTKACIGCRIAFSGHRSGQMLVVISSSVLPELTVNMLGEEDEDAIEPQQIRDALCETGNILCGNILPAVFGNDVVFHIGSPEVVSEADIGPAIAAIHDAGAIARSSLLSLEDGECQIFLHAVDGRP